MKNLSLTISSLLHPLLIPTWGFLLLLVTPNPYRDLAFDYKAMLWVIVLVFTFIIPAIFIAALKHFKMIDSYQMYHHRERVIPMLIVFLSYFGCIYVLRKFNAPTIFPLLMAVSTISIALAGMISTVWKISAHLTAMGGLVASLIIVSHHLNENYSLLIGGIILITGIVGWARLYLDAHNKDQVLAGFVLGFSAIYFPVLLTPVLG